MRSGLENRSMMQLALGNMTPMQYQNIASMAQLGASKLGYSMLTGGIGGPMAQQLQETFQQYLPEYMPAAGAQPLMVGANGGIYNYGTLQLRQLQHQQMAAQQQYQLGTGEWAYSNGFRMGMYGDLERAQANLATFQKVTGLQNQLFEVQHAGQQNDIGYAMASTEMQYRHAMESLGLQQQMWQVNTQFQRREMGIQFQQFQTQREWGREDIAYASEMAGLQYGWQMEDYDRAIRFATGRQKEQLIRQRGRTEEVFTREEGHRATQADRQEESWKWQEEKFSRERKHFEEIKALENQQFAMRKRQLTETYNLQMEHLQEQAGQAEEVYNLQKQIRDVQNDKQEEDMKYQIAQKERQIEYYEKVVFPNMEKEQKIREDMEDRYAKYLQKQVDDMSKGGKLYTTWEQMIDAVEGWLADILRMFHDEKEPPPNEPPPPDDPTDPNDPYQPTSVVPIIDDALTGKLRRGGVTAQVGQIVLNVPPGNYGSPEELARALKNELENTINDLAYRQGQRGRVW
jgi:hypothetical protein